MRRTWPTVGRLQTTISGGPAVVSSSKSRLQLAPIGDTIGYQTK